MSLRPHGILDTDVDRAYCSVGRWSVLAILVLAGSGLGGASTRQVLTGHGSRDAAATLAAGVVLLGLAALFTVPRRTAPVDAAAGAGCVLLPTRRLPVVAGWFVVVPLPAFFLLATPPEDPVSRSEAAWPLIAVFLAPAMAAWLAWRLARSDLRLRLDPLGVTIPSFWRDDVQHVRWDQVQGVLARRHPRPVLILLLERGDRPFVEIDLRIPRWRAALLAAIVQHYVDNPGERATLDGTRCPDLRMFTAPSDPGASAVLA